MNYRKLKSKIKKM